MPRFVTDRWVPLGAFVLMMMVWLVALIAKICLCVSPGVGACR